MQPPRRRQVGRRPLADHRRQRAAAQAFLHRPQQIDRPADGSQDQPIWIDAEPNEAWTIRPSKALAAMSHANAQDAAAAPGDPTGQGQGEAAGRRIVLRAHDVVQAVARQAAPRQRRVEPRIAERDGSAAAAWRLQAGKLAAKTIRIGSEARHGRTTVVLIMFYSRRRQSQGVGAGSVAKIWSGARRPNFAASSRMTLP